MARITIEDCLKKVDNRFELILLAAQRVEQLRRGAVPLVHAPKNKEVVVALREIAAGRAVPAAPGEELPPVEYFQPEPEVHVEEEEEFEGEGEGEGEAEGKPALAAPPEEEGGEGEAH